MSNTMFDSNTHGIGELITQRKLFSVPIHQRSYSWGDEQVEQFLIDINNAFNNRAKDYFIGLVVLQGPTDGVWQVLDGQQRLATVTMIYSAIRNWLKERNFNDDANQIESEYLGVRQLGGEFSTRVRLNSINNECFETHVIKSSPTEEIRIEKNNSGKRSSNYLLLDAAIQCRDWISRFTDNIAGPTENKAKSLFQLSRFIDTNVKVVSVDVATDADAYILFESLNNRGADLSALDLVKNYIFSIANATEFPHLEQMWGKLTQLIEGADADDFLKYFWTARFGIIQKSDLFVKIRTAFDGVGAADRLLRELLDAAEFAEVLDEADHPFWSDYPRRIQDGIAGIKIIGSKQARPVLYSAIKNLKEPDLCNFLEDLIVSLVRFQMIGHGRTGVLEKVLGKISPLIWQNTVTNRSGSLPLLRELMISDEQFISDFNAHHEQKISRTHYVLKELEKFKGADVDQLDTKSIFLLPTYESYPEDTYKKLGSYFILEKTLSSEFAKATKNIKTHEEVIDIGKSLFAQSNFATTRLIANYSAWNQDAADDRTSILASMAVDCWKLN